MFTLSGLINLTKAILLFVIPMGILSLVLPEPKSWTIGAVPKDRIFTSHREAAKFCGGNNNVIGMTDHPLHGELGGDTYRCMTDEDRRRIDDTTKHLK
jgi:hypothetical protein